MLTTTDLRTPPLDSSAVVTLEEHERHEVQRLAADLAADPAAMVDTQEWLDQARTLSCRVPVRLCGALRAFRRNSGVEGFLLLRGLTTMPAQLGPTPTSAGSVQRTPAEPANALILTSLQLGETIAYSAEKHGALIQDVVPVPGAEEFQGNAGSVTLQMHNENAFHPHRPDYLALLCLRNDHDNVAGLKAASIRRALPLLSEEIRRVLGEPRFRTAAPASFGDCAPTPGASPVLDGHPDDPDVRVDFASTEPLDTQAGSALSALGDAFGQVCRTAILLPGDLAIVDNRIALHGRSAFTPRYDGQDRWLQRSYIQLDLRRSRPLRPAGGNVLS